MKPVKLFEQFTSGGRSRSSYDGLAYKIVKGIELTNVESSIHLGSRAWVDIYIIEWQRKLDI